MRFLVTGGAGFIGARVVHILLTQGHEVRCLVRASTDARRLEGLPVERVIGDVRDSASVADAMRGAGGCIHLASISSWDQIRRPDMEEVVEGGTRAVLDAAVAAGNVRTVFVSSATAVNASPQPRIFDEDSPFELGGTKLRYAIAKHHCERMIAGHVQRGLPVVIVNPTEVYGPEDFGFVTAGNLRDMLRDWPAIACTGGTSIVHVDDCAAGVVAAFEKGRTGARYILGGENLSVEQLVRLTLELGGQRKPVVRVPNGLLKAVVSLMASLGIPTPVIPEVLDYATLYWFMDSSRARDELGFTPRPAREVLRPVVEWLYDAGHVKRPRALLAERASPEA